MSFIRPEAKAQLLRWREVIAGVAVFAWGIWWCITETGLLFYLGAALVIAGLATIWAGAMRARFRTADSGRGVVQIDEGQVAYLGPFSGGAVALRELDRIVLDGAATPTQWRLEQPGQPPLSIPMDAVGADGLFDAFASLQGFSVTRLLNEIEKQPTHEVVIWRASAQPKAGNRLH